MMKELIEELEYKNQDKVYYSPLLSNMPPFFKYVKRFNDYGVFEKFNKELKALDIQESGFIPLHIFRSVVEFELSIKKKIVDDFVEQMRQVDSNK